MSKEQLWSQKNDFINNMFDYMAGELASLAPTESIRYSTGFIEADEGHTAFYNLLEEYCNLRGCTIRYDGLGEYTITKKGDKTNEIYQLHTSIKRVH